MIKKNLRRWLVYFKEPTSKKFQMLKAPINVMTHPRKSDIVSRGMTVRKNYSYLRGALTKLQALRIGKRLKRRGFIVKIVTYARTEEITL